jgi:RecA/RadA recombinase
MFGLDVSRIEYDNPSTIQEVFKPLRTWEPKQNGVVHGIFADSLAALSTEMELTAEDGDKMGMRRAKEFSQELRKMCRVLPERRLLMVCSNKVRQNLDAGPYGQKWKSPGGEAIGFYASLRLRCKPPKKLSRHRKVGGEKVSRVIGVETEIVIHKSSIDKPFREATVPIIFDYGIDDVRANLSFLKDHRGKDVYQIGGRELDRSLEAAIDIVEKDQLEEQLREETIDLWEEIEQKFESSRQPKRRE